MAPCDWANGGSVDNFFSHDECFYLKGVDSILGNGHGIQGQNYVILPQGSKM